MTRKQGLAVDWVCLNAIWIAYLAALYWFECRSDGALYCSGSTLAFQRFLRELGITDARNGSWLNHEITAVLFILAPAAASVLVGSLGRALAAVSGDVLARTARTVIAGLAVIFGVLFVLGAHGRVTAPLIVVVGIGLVA